MFKVCSKCSREKPSTVDYFRSYVCAAGRRLRNRCRLCEGLEFEGPQRSAKIADARLRAASLGGRFRRKFTPEEQAEKNRRRCKEYYAKNKAKMLQAFREARKADPDRHRERDRRYNQRNKSAGSLYQKRRYARQDKVAAAAAVKRWKADNPDKVKEQWRRTYAKNRDKIAARRLEWTLRNPEARIAIRDRRRARQYGAEGTYSKDDVRRLLTQHGRVCFYCDAVLTKFHLDHFIPLARGGTNNPSNLRLSCPSCNFSKGARMPWEWMPKRFARPA